MAFKVVDRDQTDRAGQIPAGWTRGRVRPVWNFERKFVKSPVANVGVVARIRGTLEPDRIERALRKLGDIHPLLASRVVEDPDGRAYLHNDEVPEIPVRVVERSSGTSWRDALLAEHRIPFDMAGGPLIRFVLVRPKSTGLPSELIVFCQHTVCDGTALANLIRDLLSLYADPELPAAPVPPPLTLEETLPQSLEPQGLASRLKRGFMQVLNQRWRKNPFQFTNEDFVDIHQAYWDRKAYGFASLELSREESADLGRRCREHGVTVNPALVMAFILGYQDVLGPLPKPSLVVPYDLRKRSGEGLRNVFCMLVSSVEVPLRKIARADFWTGSGILHEEIGRRVGERGVFGAIADMQTLDGSFLETLGLLDGAALLPPDTPGYDRIQTFLKDRNNPAVSLSSRFGRAMPGVIMTNLGRVDFPEAGASGDSGGTRGTASSACAGGPDDIQVERMYFTPSAAETIPLQLGAVGAGGTITVTLNYIAERGTGGQAADFGRVCERARDYLGFGG